MNILIKNWNIFWRQINYNNKKGITNENKDKGTPTGKKLTQQALAEQLGINQTSLSKIESGVSTPDAQLLVDLSRFFHVTTDYILLLSEERLTADSLLANNMCNLKKYQHLIAIYQKMTQKQQGDLYNFLCSMLGMSDDL